MPIYYVPKEDFKIVTLEELKPYLELAPDIDFKICLILSWLTGMRISELIQLKKEIFIINEEEQELTITHKALKHGRVGYATFSFEDPFILEIIEYLKLQKGDFILKRRHRTTYEKILLKLNRKIHGKNIKKYITFHYLRHSRLTYLARILKAFPEELKAWTGHRSNAFEEYFAPRRVERFKGKIR